MINYLKSILPRIQQHSKALDDVATFADIPWGFLDDDGHKVTYIFRRNNELLVSKQGEVVTGRWEYLPVMKSLLIEHEGRKRMYNQGYLNETIMLLRKDGTDELFPLGNVQLMPELDIERYVEGVLMPQILIKNTNGKNSAPCTLKLADGRTVVIIKKAKSRNCFDIGNQVEILDTKTMINISPENGFFKFEDDSEIKVEDSKIQEVYKWVEYRSKQALVLTIRCEYEVYFDGEIGHLRMPNAGDKVSGTTLPENKWIALDNEDTCIKILNGRVLKTYSIFVRKMLLFTLVAIVILCMVALLSSDGNN